MLGESSLYGSNYEMSDCFRTELGVNSPGEAIPVGEDFLSLSLIDDFIPGGVLPIVFARLWTTELSSGDPTIKSAFELKRSYFVEVVL